MRLKDDVEPPRRGRGPQRPERGANLRRVMAIVVDHRHAALHASPFHAPAGAAERGQRGAHRFDSDAQFHGQGCRGGGVQDVVLAENRRVEAAQRASVEFEFKRDSTGSRHGPHNP